MGKHLLFMMVYFINHLCFKEFFLHVRTEKLQQNVVSICLWYNVTIVSLVVLHRALAWFATLVPKLYLTNTVSHKCMCSFYVP